MRRQIMFLVKSVIAVVLLTLCMNAPAYASHAGHDQGHHVVRPADPSPWTSLDIGSVGVPGSSTSSGDTVTVTGSGTDIWYSADQFQYAYQSLQGDGALIARVDSQTGSDPWAKAGIMIRNTLDPSSAYAYALVSPGNGVAFQTRAVASGSSSHVFGPAVQAPYWLELVRAGSLFSAYASSDGQTWVTVGTPQTISMNPTIYIGLAVTSHNNAALNTAIFSSVSPSPNALTPPLTSVSDLALNGTASASTSLPPFVPANGIDGSSLTYWENALNDLHPWFQVDLGLVYPITEIKTTWLDTNTRTFRIDGSNDRKVWTAITTVTNDTNPLNDLTLSQPAVTRYLRLVIPQNTNLIYKLAGFQAFGGISVPPGPQGNQGAQGAVGAPGSQGTPGSQGAPGSQGTQGAVGSQGTQGVPGIQGAPGWRGPSGAINLALNRPAVASSTRGLPDYAPGKAVDGSENTRWSSATKGEFEIFQVDLGTSYAIKEVKLHWGWRAYARMYAIIVSNDSTNWFFNSSEIGSVTYFTTTGHGGDEDLTGLSGSGRYITLVMLNVNCSTVNVSGKSILNATGITASCNLLAQAKKHAAKGQQGAGTAGLVKPSKASKPHTKDLHGAGTTGPVEPSANPEPDSQNYYALKEFEVYGDAVGAKGSVGDVGLPGPQGSQGPQGLTAPNLALGRPVTASSTLTGSDPGYAVDNTTHYWSSGPNNATEWLTIDLGATYTVREMKLFWAGPYYATSYRLQVSDDNVNWTTLYRTTTGTGGIEDLTRMVGSGRYVRVYMTNHANPPVALAEVQVYGYPTNSLVDWW